MDNRYPRRNSGTSAPTAPVYGRSVQYIRPRRVTELCLPSATERTHSAAEVS